jgi:hypothetical protein
VLLCAAACAGELAAQARFVREGAPVPVLPKAVVDLNGDGSLDAIGASGLALNDGTGYFTAVSGWYLPSLVVSPRRFADVNGDGLIDAVTPTDVWTGFPGTTTFLGTTQTFALPGPPNSTGGGVDLGDVDGDGDLDMACGVVTALAGGNYAAGPLRLMLNNGVGNFSAAPPGAFPVGATAGAQVFLRDLDLDGDLDMLLETSWGLASPPALLLGDGSGTFLPAPLPGPFATDGSFLAVGDFDGDGAPDVAGVCQSAGGPFVAFAFNAPAGFASVATAPLPTAAPLHALLPIDADGDGDDDLLVSTTGGGAAVYAFSVAGGLAPLISWPAPSLIHPHGVTRPGAEATPDLDGDGDADLLVMSPYLWTVPYMNGGAFGFVPIGPDGSSSGAGGAVVGALFDDLDADGDLDAWWLQSPGVFSTSMQTATRMNAGDGVFVPGPTSGQLPSRWFAPIDFDADGDRDLFGFGDAALAQPDVLYFANWPGSFTFSAQTTFAGPATIAVAADVDGDGDEDLLYGRKPPTGFAPTKLLRNVGGTFAAPTTVSAASAPYRLIVADFDGDGSQDLLELNAPAGATQSAYVYAAVGGAATPIVQSWSATSSHAAAEDMDGDGDADVVVGGTIYQSNAGVLSAVGTLNPPLSNGARFADVDEDGLADLVQSDGAIYPRIGTLAFGPRVEGPVPYFVPPGTTAQNPVLADADGDGDLDLFHAEPHLARNVFRALRHRKAVRIGYSADVDVFGSPGSTALLFAAPNVADYVAAPGLRVLIDPATAQFVATVPLGVAGSATPGFASLPVSVPNAPALVGLSLHWQAIETTQGRLTNRLTSTVLSF